MNNERTKVTLVSNNVWIAEENSADPDALIVKFVICDFKRNKNGVLLNRKTINNWLSTLLNNPVVGKIGVNADGDDDFSNHNMTISVQENADGELERVVEFNTEAYGTFTNVAIETIDNAEYIVATARIWKRFARACNIIQERITQGTLHTSWEIIVEDSEKQMVDGVITDVINSGRFIGHCLLSKYVEPAYDSSGILSVAEVNTNANLGNDNSEFVKALIDDLSVANTEHKDGEKIMNKNNKNIVESQITDVSKQTNEPEVDVNTVDTKPETEEVETEANAEVEVSQDTTEDNTEVSETVISSLTVDDICKKLYEKIDKHERGYILYLIPEEHIVIWKKPFDPHETALTATKYSYTVSGDDVEVDEGTVVEIVFEDKLKAVQLEYSELKEKFDAQCDTIITLNSQFEELNTKYSSLNEEFTSLSEFKSKYDAEIAEKEHLEKVEEIKSYALKSNKITLSEFEDNTEIKDAIQNIDYSTIKSIIADRVVNEVATPVSTSAVSTSTTLKAQIIEDNKDTSKMSIKDKKNVMSDFLANR